MLWKHWFNKNIIKSCKHMNKAVKFILRPDKEYNLKNFMTIRIIIYVLKLT